MTTFYLVKTASATDGRPISEIVAETENVIEALTVWTTWQEEEETDESYRIENDDDDWVIEIHRLGRVADATTQP